MLPRLATHIQPVSFLLCPIMCRLAYCIGMTSFLLWIEGVKRYMHMCLHLPIRKHITVLNTLLSFIVWLHSRALHCSVLIVCTTSYNVFEEIVKEMIKIPTFLWFFLSAGTVQFPTMCSEREGDTEKCTFQHFNKCSAADNVGYEIVIEGSSDISPKSFFYTFYTYIYTALAERTLFYKARRTCEENWKRSRSWHFLRFYASYIRAKMLLRSEKDPFFSFEPFFPGDSIYYAVLLTSYGAWEAKKEMGRRIFGTANQPVTKGKGGKNTLFRVKSNMCEVYYIAQRTCWWVVDGKYGGVVFCTS